MKAIILAAGYGTRLQEGLDKLKIEDKARYEIIKDSIEGKHKALVELAGKPLIHYTVENIEKTSVDGIYVVTNDKYYNDFEEWRATYKGNLPINVVNDGTKTNEDRRGAFGDFYFLLNERNITDDVLLIGGDNLLTFELEKLVEFYNQKNTNTLIAYKETDKERIMRANLVKFDKNYYVFVFEEKPENPGDEEWVCPPIYIYKSDTIKKIRTMEMTDNIKDHIGNVPMLLHKEIPFHVLPKEGILRYDLGSIDDYNNAETYIKSLKEK